MIQTHDNQNNCNSKNKECKRAIIRIYSFPSPDSFVNPYLKMFYKHLSAYGYEWRGAISFNRKWFRENINKCDVLHINWPEHIWANHRWPVAFWRIVNTSYLLIRAKLAKKVIVLTIHNLSAHGNNNIFVRLGNIIMSRICDIAISHSYWAATETVKMFKCDPAKVIVMFHGTYNGEYPQPQSRDKTCQHYGLKEGVPIVGFFGFIRRYKGVGTLVNAFTNEIKAQLLIAGRFLHAHDHESFLEMEQRSSLDMVTIFKNLSSQEFSDLMNACAMIVLPYKEVTGSGVLLAALTFGKPVIVSDQPYFKEIMGREPKAFLTFKTNDSVSLKEAIEQMLASDLTEASQAAKRLADIYKWEEVIKPVAVRLDEIMENKYHIKRKKTS